jgi:hypothetical protein
LLAPNISKRKDEDYVAMASKHDAIRPKGLALRKNADKALKTKRLHAA